MRDHPASARVRARIRVIFTGAVAVAFGMLLPTVFVGVTAQTAAAGPIVDGCASASTALTSLCVQSSTNGSPTAPYNDPSITALGRIGKFDWLVNEDSTGNPSLSAGSVATCLPASAKPTPPEKAADSSLSIYDNAGGADKPAGQPGGLTDCPWPSVRAVPGHSSVVADGNEGDVAKLANLLPGKYLLSVTAAKHKIDGIHFTVAAGKVASVNDIAGAKFVVRMNPLPKKTATVRIHVFNDNASTNGQWDGQTETLQTCATADPDLPLPRACNGVSDGNSTITDPSTDMSGFSVQITDVLNPVTTDVYGNPLCTQYMMDDNGNVFLNTDGTPNPLVFDNGGATGGMLAGTESTCISDHYGDIVIPNMGPNRYAATVIPPDPRTHNGDQWVQTTTLEGGHDWDTWNIEGGTGYDTELIVGGERVPPVAHGFVKLTHADGQMSIDDPAYYDASSGFTSGPKGNGELTGTIMVGRAYIGSGGASPLAGTNLANAKADGAIEDGLISINCIATCNAPTDSEVWVGRAHKDGTFDVKGLQTGDYSVAFWDESQNYILAVLAYHVTSAPTAPMITAATRTGNNNTTLRLTFDTNSGLSNGTNIVLAGGTPSWAGNFRVTNVQSNGTLVTISPRNGTPNPTASATTLPTMTSPAVQAYATGSCVGGSPCVPTVNFTSDPGLAVGTTVYFSSKSSAGTVDPKWTGNFQVLTVSNGGRTVTLAKVDPTTKPTGAPTYPLSMNVTDAGQILLPGWFTDLQGSVFNDLNGNGKRDVCRTRCQASIDEGYAKNADGNWEEPGIPDFTLTVRTRGNSLQDQGAAVAKTNDEGTFDLSQGYPLGQFLIFEAYNTRFKNIGYSYTTDNDPTEHTVISSQVDINFLPIIGLSAKIDVGVQPYEGAENGGIVGTVTYDVTRNEFDPAYSVQEDYQPGIPNIPVQLWKSHETDKPKPAPYSDGAAAQVGISKSTGTECVRREADRGKNAVTDPSQDCKPFDYYITESWQRPTGCLALDINGHRLAGEKALPAPPSTVDYSHNPDTAQPNAQSVDCVESPMNGFQIGGNGTVDGNYALTNLITKAALDSKQGDLSSLYTDTKDTGAFWDDLTNDDYVVEVVNPADTVNNTPVTGTKLDPDQGGYVKGGTAVKKLYRFTDETSINVFSGDTYVPQGGFGPAVPDQSGTGDPSLHVTPKNMRVDSNSLGAGTVAKCVGTVAEVTDDNKDLRDTQGSPYIGQKRPVCDSKIVKVAGGRSVNPAFFIYTDVPIPSKFFGLMNDDLNVNVDRRSVLLGEVAPVSNGPVGIYDENGNWKYTAHTDVNGFYEVLLPSMDTYNCPLPAGPCPNVYRLVGNDPGTLAHRNLDYNPQFRTIATEFQAWAGVIHPVDQAPTHQGITIEGPAAQFGALSLCKLDDTNPVLFAIDKPYFDSTSPGGNSYTLKGTGFDANASVTLTGKPSSGHANGVWVTQSSTSGSGTVITFTVPSGIPVGPYQLDIHNPSPGLSTVNGLTFHVLGSGYLSKTDVYEVKPVAEVVNNVATNPSTWHDNRSARTFTPQNDAWDPATDTPAGYGAPAAAPFNQSKYGAPVTGGRAIQRAIEAAHLATYGDGSRRNRGDGRPKMIVVYPNDASNYAAHNPNAAYFENVVVHGNVKLQGVGPGGVTATTNVWGTNIDASQFWSATQVVAPGANQQTSDGSYSDDWRTFANGINRTDTTVAELPEGEGVLAIAESQSQYGGTNAPNSSVTFRPGVDGILLTGGDQQGNPGNVNTAPGAIGDGVPGPTAPGPAQGGAITLDRYVRDFNITNNLIQSNGGTYGAVRIGTPDIAGTSASNHNDRVTVADNRFVANGGTNLAGALGLFYGADNYSVKGNDFCGNFSAEYGGAVSQYGLSPGGSIKNNRIYYNQAYDEGGGIFIAGNLPASTTALSKGAGAVTIDGNALISNQSNDDGGGIRFLMAGNFPMLVQNNIIANNLSTHEGAGVALDDAPNVTLVNNTIVKNITTATAATNAAIADGTKPANPAGISTGGNSPQLQKTLSNDSPNWSRPKMLNNILADNRAGWVSVPASGDLWAISGIGQGGPTDIQRWDVGVSSAAGLCTSWHYNNNDQVGHCTSALNTADFGAAAASNTTNALAAPQHANTFPTSYRGSPNIAAGTDGTVAAPGGVGFELPQDFGVDILGWRVNTNVSFPVIVARMAPINLLANYHLLNPSTTFAQGVGVTSGAGATAPAYDIDNDQRPTGQNDHPDRGADQSVPVVSVPTGDLGVAVTANKSQVPKNGNSTQRTVVFTVTLTNVGTSLATGVTFTQAQVNNLSWQNSSVSCTAAGLSTCPNSFSSTTNSRTVDIAGGGSVILTITATVSTSNSNSPSPAVYGVSVAAPAGFTDTNNNNNSSSASVVRA